MSVYPHAHAHMHTCTHAHKQTCGTRHLGGIRVPNLSRRARIHTHTHTHTHTYTHTHTHAQTHTPPVVLFTREASVPNLSRRAPTEFSGASKKETSSNSKCSKYIERNLVVNRSPITPKQYVCKAIPRPTKRPEGRGRGRGRERGRVRDRERERESK